MIYIGAILEIKTSKTAPTTHSPPEPYDSMSMLALLPPRLAMVQYRHLGDSDQGAIWALARELLTDYHSSHLLPQSTSVMVAQILDSQYPFGKDYIIFHDRSKYEASSKNGNSSTVVARILPDSKGTSGDCQIRGDGEAVEHRRNICKGRRPCTSGTVAPWIRKLKG